MRPHRYRKSPELFPETHRVLLVGMLSDKDWAGTMDILNEAADEFVATTPDSNRALPAEELGKYLEKFRKPVQPRI
ncbi:MAG: hypothetical protein V8T45_01795 [Oscillospiraceae bacterium]